MIGKVKVSSYPGWIFDLDLLKEGRVEVDGDTIVVTVHRQDPKPNSGDLTQKTFRLVYVRRLRGWAPSVDVDVEVVARPSEVLAPRRVSLVRDFPPDVTILAFWVEAESVTQRAAVAADDATCDEVVRCLARDKTLGG